MCDEAFQGRVVAEQAPKSSPQKLLRPDGPHKGLEPQYVYVLLAADAPQSVSLHHPGPGTPCRGHWLAVTWETQTNSGETRRVGQRKGITGTNRSHPRSKGMVSISSPNTGWHSCRHVFPFSFPNRVNSRFLKAGTTFFFLFLFL